MKIYRKRYVSINEFYIFSFSLIITLYLLLMERSIGIGWDFHPDSVTYATKSSEIASAVYGGTLPFFNNGYYVLSSILGMNIFVITFMNMLFFSYTNVMIYRIHKSASKFIKRGKTIWILCLLLLICNPYRMHLATTMLKDSLIIMLLVFAFSNKTFSKIIMLPFLSLFRIVSIAYFSIFFKRIYVFLGISFVLLLWAILGDIVNVLILKFNSVEMVFRDFDRIPTFQDQGIIGAIMRSIIWPILAFTGGFVFLSPDPAYAIVSSGIFASLFYMILMTGRVHISLSAYATMMLFGILVTGFTSYLRYVYPIIVVLPLIAIQSKAIINMKKYA